MTRTILVLAVTCGLLFMVGCGGKMTEEKAESELAEATKAIADGDLDKAETILTSLEKQMEPLAETTQKKIKDALKSLEVKKTLDKALP
ncbi:MAG: hypothetical protein ACYS8X_07460 [Planctomycetota bacterium]|jgi:hypothetical protein